MSLLRKYKQLTHLLLLLLAGYSWSAYARPVHHELEVWIEPESHAIKVTDTIKLPEPDNTEYRFQLNSNLKPELTGKGELEVIAQGAESTDTGMDRDLIEHPDSVQVSEYRVTGVTGGQFTLRYSGTINYPLRQTGGEYARGFSQSPGIISTQGVYLAGSSHWVPAWKDQLLTYRMSVHLPSGWQSVAQGSRSEAGEWRADKPTEEIHLIAATFHFYEKHQGKIRLQAYLRSEDAALAEKYLGVTGQYLEMYNKLIGPYPYSKFALVENFWETGYGMPSFTLLGSKVIRFPFILHSSYPHELLHNWWGNSVYVDFTQGNWCEGLTTYMADHLVAEQRGRGAVYRRTALQAYGDYVTAENDFPLSRFRSRHDAASSAIGYNKAAMVFDMLRDQVGDEVFRKSLARFYRDNRFKRAGYKEIAQAFEQETGKDWDAFFDQWIQRPGAPVIKLLNPRLDENKQGTFEVRFTLAQQQDGKSFDLKVPVVVQFEDNTERRFIHLDQTSKSFLLEYDRRPVKLLIDPGFNLFRRLHNEEIPPALSQMFGATNPLMILPSTVDKEALGRYKQLAAIWRKDKPLELVLDAHLDQLPKNRAIWIMDRQNRFAGSNILVPPSESFELTDKELAIGKDRYALAEHSIVVTARNPRNSAATVAFMHIHSKDAVEGMARKLPHYGKYSYLAFSGSAPDNRLKGIWTTAESPLVKAFSSVDSLPPPPARPALAELPPLVTAESMMEDINYLSSSDLQGREPGGEGIAKAAKYIARAMQGAGLRAAGDNGDWLQPFSLEGPRGTTIVTNNIIGLLPGTSDELAHSPVVISAHYDHLGHGWPDVRKGNEGKIHPGADDNASGVAVMLELARQLGKSPMKRPVLFLATSAEEAGLVGARHFVTTNKRWPHIMANLNLDTVGRLEDHKLMVFGASSAREWPFIFMGIGAVTGIQSEIVTKELDASDNIAFVEAGIPAIQLFSGIHQDYHRPSDTADKIDAAGLVSVARVSREIVEYLAQREEPLTNQIAQKQPNKQKKKPSRKVSSGVVPDFAFSGSGVRVQEVIPDSPAMVAGILPEDIIIGVEDTPVTDLRSYAEVLRTFSPGQTVIMKVIRAEKPHRLRITLQAR